jgi:glycosyltransferase involved in cell wall biosynthesis
VGKVNVCVVTPVFNGNGLIQDTVSSIIEQNNRNEFNISYYICDGGSTDGTLQYLEEVMANYNSEGMVIKVISDNDDGMYDALSKGFVLAGNSHDLYCYINAGDYFSPYAFSVVSKLIDDGFDWITGASVFYNPKGYIRDFKLPLGYDRDLIRKGYYGKLLPFIQQESTFWSVSLHSKIDFSDLAKFKYAGDYYLWNLFSKFNDLWVAGVWLSGFRSHEGQLSSVHNFEYMREFDLIRDGWGVMDFLKALGVFFINLLPQQFRKFFHKKMISIQE